VSRPEDPLTGYRFVITLDPGDAYLPRPQADQVPLIADHHEIPQTAQTPFRYFFTISLIAKMSLTYE